MGLSVDGRRILMTKWIGQVLKQVLEGGKYWTQKRLVRRGRKCLKEENTDDIVDWSEVGGSVEGRRILTTKRIFQLWEEVYIKLIVTAKATIIRMEC